MAWDGVERRGGHRNDEDPITALHRRLDRHFEEEVANATKIVALEEQIKELRKGVDDILEIKTQFKGALKFISTMAAIVAAGAAGWAWIVAHVDMVVKK